MNAHNIERESTVDASVAEERLARARDAERLGKLDDARGILREGLALASDLPALEVQLALARLDLLGGQDLLPEAESLLAAVQKAASVLGSSQCLARALHLQALLERQRGNADKAREYLDQSPAPRDAPEGAEAGELAHYRGLLELDAGDYDAAERSYYQAHRLYRRLGSEAGIAAVDDSLAGIMLRRGKTNAALRFCQQSLELKRAVGDRWGEAITLGTLGRIFLQQARYTEARQAFTADLQIARELGDQRGLGIMLNSLGTVAGAEGRLDEAVERFHESMSQVPGPVNEAFAHVGLAHFFILAGQLDAAATETESLAQILLGNPHPTSLDASLTALRGALAGRRGQIEEGIRLLSESIARFEQLHEPLDTIELLYELRDLHQARGDMVQAVAAMSKALDLLNACGARRAVADVEQWLRRVNHPGLTRLALERHLPEHLVKQILGGSLNLPPPQRQNVTVLFNDVCGFTPLTESLEPEKVVDLLNEWFSEATIAIRRHGGVVDKFIGDAVMALFGVPEPRPDAAAAAVRAALDMRAALAAMNARQEALGDVVFQADTGIATGEAVVGFIGSHVRQSFTAIGDTVNTAARLVGAAKGFPGCDILISDSTECEQRKFAAAETTFLGSIALKGKTRKVSVYQVR